MQILAAILGLLPSLIQGAEALFSKQPKSGEQKKAEVEGAVASFAKGMATVTTGGAKETWVDINALMPLISSNIDMAVDAMNNMGLLGDTFNEDHAS